MRESQELGSKCGTVNSELSSGSTIIVHRSIHQPGSPLNASVRFKYYTCAFCIELQLEPPITSQAQRASHPQRTSSGQDNAHLYNPGSAGSSGQSKALPSGDAREQCQRGPE